MSVHFPGSLNKLFSLPQTLHTVSPCLQSAFILFVPIYWAKKGKGQEAGCKKDMVSVMPKREALSPSLSFSVSLSPSLCQCLMHLHVACGFLCVWLSLAEFPFLCSPRVPEDEITHKQCKCCMMLKLFGNIPITLK